MSKAKSSSIRRNFKKKESVVCSMFGCKRLPLCGQLQPDCLSNDWSIEIFTKSIPKFLKQEYSQAKLGASKKGKGCIPICVWTEKNQPYKKGFVLLTLKDFIRNFV